MNLEPPVTYENKTDFSSDRHDLENGLPKYLQESIAQIKTNRKILDCLAVNYDTLESDINCAQLHNEISCEQAWYLCETYLGIEKLHEPNSSV